MTRFFSAWHKSFGIGLLVLALTLWCQLSIQATTVVLMPDDDLIVSSRAIVHGTVTQIESRFDPAGQSIYTYFTLHLQQVFKGNISDSTIVVRQLGGRVGGFQQVVYGSPEFAVGEEVLLFLNTADDGALRVAHLCLGKYSVVTDEHGGRQVHRTMDGVEFLEPTKHQVTGSASTSDMEWGRFLEKVHATLTHQADRVMAFDQLNDSRPLVTIPREYLESSSAGGFQPKFTLLGSGSRWFEADTNTPVIYRINTNNPPRNNGTPIPGNGVTEFTATLAAWTNIANASLILQSGGTTTAVGRQNDGVNAISFNDPLNQIDDPVNCGGVLAIGGFTSSNQTIVVSGRTFNRIIDADVAFNNNFDCFLGNPANLAEVMTHEVGHSIGLGHSSENVNEANATLRDATMFFRAHGDGRGAVVRTDDIAGAAFIYPVAGGAATPTITSFNPTSGTVGTAVTITGTNFTGASVVSFNNLNAAFTVNSATQISATVPNGATTGLIRVTTPGGTATSATNFTVNAGGGGDTQAPTVTVTSPNGGETLTSTATFTATWTASDNVGITRQDIALSTNGGSSFSVTLASGLAGTVRSFVFTVPSGAATTTARLRVTAFDAVNNAGSDASNQNFTIQAPQTATELKVDDGTLETGLVQSNAIVVNRLTPTSYPAKLDRVRIRFTQFSGQSSPVGRSVKLLVFTNPTGAAQPPGNPTFLVNQQITIPQTASFADFVLTNGPTINAGDFFVGYQLPNPAAGVGFSLDTSSASQQRTFVSTNNAVSFSQLVLSGNRRPNALIRALISAGSTSGGNTIPPSAAVLSPSENEVITAGAPFTIRWTSSDDSGLSYHDVELSTDGGQTFTAQIATGVEGSVQDYGWFTSRKESTRAVIRVTAVDADGNISSATSGVFTIAGNNDFTLDFESPELVGFRGEKGTLVVKIDRTGGFTGPVTITAPDTKALKIKLSPASQSATGSTVSFTYKVKKTAVLGAQQLTFTGKDAEGRTRTNTVTWFIQEN